jgi:hypothetical protein
MSKDAQGAGLLPFDNSLRPLSFHSTAKRKLEAQCTLTRLFHLFFIRFVYLKQGALLKHPLISRERKSISEHPRLL